MDNKKCPICEIDLSHPFPLFCEQCGWDLKHDITLVPSLHEIPENILEKYQKRAEISRRIWMERLGAVKRQKELEEEIDRLRTERNAGEGQKEQERLEAVKKQKELEEKNEKLCAENKSLQAEKVVEEMIDDFTKAIELNPKNVVAYKKRGDCYFMKNRTLEYDKAIMDYSNVIKLEPNNIDAYIKRAIAYLNCSLVYSRSVLNCFEKAILDCTKAIQLDPNNIDAYKKRADVYCYENLNENALEDYTKVIELNPNDANSYIYRGDFYDKRCFYSKAIEDYTKAIQLDPCNYKAYIKRGSLYIWSLSLDIKIGKPWHSRSFNEACIEIQECTRSIEDFRKAIKLKDNESFFIRRELRCWYVPSDIYKIYTYRGKLYELIGQYNNAIEDCTEAIRLNPRYSVAYENRAVAYKKLGKDGEAESDFNKSQELKRK